MMRFQRIAAAAACALLLACPASAQLIGSGHVMGNGTGSPAAPTDTQLLGVMNQAGSGLTFGGNTRKLATVSGTIANGHCRSTDANGNDIDAGGACTVGGGGGTVNAGTKGQIAAYNASTNAVVGVPAQCTPIETFAGAGDNATDNVAPFNNLVAAFGSHGGCVGLSSGIYQLSAALTVTYPTTVPYVVSVKGAGQDLSILNWAAAPTGAGLALATNKAGHALHLSDLSFRVGVAAPSSAAFSVRNSTALGAILNSTINNVSFLGSDGGGVTDYWGIGANIVTQSAVNFTDDDFWGPSGGASGIGISVSSTSSPGFGVIYNVTGSNFYTLSEGFQYGDWIQGVAINDCNFTTGGSGIVVSAGATGLLAELSVVNSQFGMTTGNGIFFLSPVSGSNISNNYFLTFTNKEGVSATTWGGGTIVGNVFGVAGSVAGGQNAIFLENSQANSPTTIVANTFLNNTTAVDLVNTSSQVTVGLNTYIGDTNKVVNGGTTACPASASGNCVGTATSGAGFVP
jgi:hypothetical protein